MRAWPTHDPWTKKFWIFPFEWFQETNEAAKRSLHADFVALVQLGQSGRKIARQVRLLGVLGQAYVKVARNGRRYIIFKGPAGVRPLLAGTRYSAENPTVACFVVGTRDILMDAAKATRVAVIAFVAIDVMKECLSDQFSLASLGVSVASDVAQATLAAGAGIVAGVLASAAAAPVVLTFIIVVGAGFVAGMRLSTLDQEFQLTERARARLMAMEKDAGSLLYRVEHGAAAAGHEAITLGNKGITVARYATNLKRVSIGDMLKYDGDDGRNEIPLWQMAP